MRTSRWNDEKRKGEEEEDRGREQRKLCEFDALFLSVDGSVITKARERPSHWLPAKSDVIVSIAGLPRDDRAFLSLSPSPVPHSYNPSSSHLKSPCVPLADSRPMMHKETFFGPEPGNARIHSTQPQISKITTRISPDGAVCPINYKWLLFAISR